VIARGTLYVMTVLATTACGRRIDLGSDLIWSAQHEIGDLSEWSTPSPGGSMTDATDAVVAVSTAYAHSGKYSVKLTNGAVGAVHTARLWHQGDFPREAFYSVWYYLPRAYQTKVDWTILQFRTPTNDPTVISQFLDVNLRSLPGGEMILSIYDHRPQYLRLPTPDPAIEVPIGQWFQIEVLFRNVADDSGHFTLWLDGKPYYDIQHRPMASDPGVYWTPCSITGDLSPSQSELYVDDAAISYDWLTADSVL